MLIAKQVQTPSDLAQLLDAKIWDPHNNDSLGEVHNVVDGRWAVDGCYLCCSLFIIRNWKSMLRLGRAALSCSRLWDWHDFQAKKAERKRLQTCQDDVPNQSKATEHDRLNQQNLLKSTNLSRFTCKLSTEKPSSSPKFIGDGKHMNFIDLADLAACTRCATFMLLAHCEGIVVGTIGLYLVPLACFVYFPLELDTELLNGSSINTREVCPSRLQVEPWNAELCFGSSCSKKTDVWQVQESSRLTENPWTPEWPRFALACAPAGILSTAAWSSRQWQQCQPSNGNAISWHLAVRRRFSSSSLCHGCSSCVRCCCATIHGKRAIGTCTGQPRGLQSWRVE